MHRRAYVGRPRLICSRCCCQLAAAAPLLACCAATAALPEAWLAQQLRCSIAHAAYVLAGAGLSTLAVPCPTARGPCEEAVIPGAAAGAARLRVAAWAPLLAPGAMLLALAVLRGGDGSGGGGGGGALAVLCCAARAAAPRWVAEAMCPGGGGAGAVGGGACAGDLALCYAFPALLGLATNRASRCVAPCSPAAVVI